MANQDVTQLTQQTGTADATSLFYAVTGGTLDTGLPLSVLVNSLGLTGTPTTPTATVGTNTTQIASTAFVQSQLTSTLAAYAPLASPTFTGTVVIPTVTLSGGTINSATIGATTPSTGAFTTLSTTGLATLNSLTTATATITGGTINGTPVGGTTASTGAFTTLSASSTVSGTGFSTYLASPPAIGGTAAAAGSFTTLTATTSGSTASITVTDTGANGSNIKLTGNGGTNPSKTVRVNSGNFQVLNNAYSTTILSLTDAGALSVAGSVTPSTTGGIVGTTTNDNATTGSVGEYLAVTPGSATSMTSGSAVNLASLSLTAGDWDVWASIATTPAGTTTTSAVIGGLTTTSGAMPSWPAQVLYQYAAAASAQLFLPITMQRFSLSATTTIFCVVQVNFAVSTLQANAAIFARRRR